jgi:hypothetical protein
MCEYILYALIEVLNNRIQLRFRVPVVLCRLPTLQRVGEEVNATLAQVRSVAAANLEVRPGVYPKLGSACQLKPCLWTCHIGGRRPSWFGVLRIVWGWLRRRDCGTPSIFWNS